MCLLIFYGKNIYGFVDLSSYKWESVKIKFLCRKEDTSTK